MIKEMKHYLQYYLGCEVEVKRNNCDNYHVGRICEISLNSNHGDWIEVMFPKVVGVMARTFEGISNSNMHNYFIGEDHIKPIIRPLSDITNEEWNELGRPIRNGQNIRTAGDLWKMNAEETHYLLSKRFDLFGLIESGLAIDKTKLSSK